MKCLRGIGFGIVNSRLDNRVMWQDWHALNLFTYLLIYLLAYLALA